MSASNAAPVSTSNALPNPTMLLRLESNNGDRIYLMPKWHNNIRVLEVTGISFSGRTFFHLQHIDTIDARLILQDLCYSLKRAADMAWGRS